MSDSYADDYERDDPPGTSEKQELEPAPLTLTISQTASRVGVSAKTVRRMIARNELPGAWIAYDPKAKIKQWLVPVVSIEILDTTRQARPVNTATGELTALRTQVQNLENDLRLERALRQNSDHQLQELHQTVRLMIGAQPPQKAPRWWRKN